MVYASMHVFAWFMFSHLLLHHRHLPKMTMATTTTMGMLHHLPFSSLIPRPCSKTLALFFSRHIPTKTIVNRVPFYRRNLGRHFTRTLMAVMMSGLLMVMALPKMTTFLPARNHRLLGNLVTIRISVRSAVLLLPLKPLLLLRQMLLRLKTRAYHRRNCSQALFAFPHLEAHKHPPQDQQTCHQHIGFQYPRPFQHPHQH